MMIPDTMPSVFICSPCPKGSTTFPKSATSWDLMFKCQAVGNSSHSHLGRFPTLVSLNPSTRSLDSLASCAQGLLWKLAPSWGSIPSPPLVAHLFYFPHLSLLCPCVACVPAILEGLSVKPQPVPGTLVSSPFVLLFCCSYWKLSTFLP